MKFRISGTTDPLRLALALLVLALLLPLALLIWFFIKSVQAERTLARQQLVTAYRSQVMINVGEAVQNWQNMQQDLLERARDPRNRITLHWLRQSNIQAVMLVDRQGRMGFPVNDAAQSGMVRFPVHLEELRTSLPSLGEDASLWLAAIDQVQQSLEAATDDPRLVLGFMMRVTELLPEPLVEIRSMLLDWWQQQFFSESGIVAKQSISLQQFLLKRLLALHEVQPLPAGLYRQFAVEAERFDMMFALIDFYNQHLRMQNRTANDHWRFLLLRSESAGREYVANFILESDQGTIIIQATESQMRQFLQPVLRNPGLEESAWLRLKSPRGNFSGTEVGADAEALFSIELPDPFLRWRLDVGFPDERHLIRSMRQQTALSIYAGVALLLLIMLAGVLSVRQIRQQMQLNKLQNDFIGMVSHELRTPLASMRMLVETLQEGRYRDPDTLREYLDLIAGENQRLSRLVDSFLSFSRMRRGMSQFQRRQVSPGEAVQLALAATKPHMSAPNVEFGYSIADNVPCIFADPDAIATVLINLLENAYKYSGDRKDIRLQVDCVNDEVRFAVSDNGIGISAKEQKLIFREFYQVDNRLARKAEGSGLGLSINKHIVRAHGGRITVDSTPGQGSTFTVSIPALQT